MPLLKSRRSSGRLTDAAGESLQATLDRAALRADALERLVGRAEQAAGRLEKLDATTAQLQSLEERLKALEGLASGMAGVREQAEEIDQSHRRIATQLTHEANDVERLRAELDKLRDATETAALIKNELARAEELQATFKDLSDTAGGLEAKVADVDGALARLGAQQEELERRHKHGLSLLELANEEAQRTGQRVEEQQRRVEQLGHVTDEFATAAEGMTDTRHQLAALKALADQVMQRSAALEEHREAIDRVAARATNLADAMRQVEAGMETQRENVRSLRALELEVDRLQEVHQQVLAQAEAAEAQVRALGDREAAAKRELTSLHDALRVTAERFDHESRGLDSVSNRIADLRGNLNQCETRVERLSATTERVADAETRTEQLAKQLATVAEGVGATEEHLEGIASLRGDVDRLLAMVDAVSSRATRIEELKPKLDAVMEDFATLSRTGEAIKESVGQMRAVYNESLRIRESQAETKSWLEEARDRMAALQEHVQQLDAMRPGVESLRKEAERIARAMNEIDERQAVVEKTSNTLASLTADAAKLEEQAASFASRLDLMERSFTAVTLHAKDADRVAEEIGAVAAEVRDVQGRAAEVERVTAACEERVGGVEQLSEDARQLAEELTQREETLRATMEHLKEAATLRQEAAEAAQRLGDETRELTGALATSEERARRLESLAAELEDRSASFRFVEKRLAQFEDQLTAWDNTERTVSRGLEQLNARKATVDALQGDIKRLFEIAERSAEDVQAIAEARHEIAAMRAELEQALREVERADAAVDGVEARKRQLEQLERRLARADALAMDIRASLETLHSQKAAIDQAVQQAGSLTFQSRQAESLIEQLREEREITSRIKTALEELRDETDEAAEAG